MSEPIKLAQVDVPEVDRGRIGISYSGGGPLVLVELGCAKAFIECGIRPVLIAATDRLSGESFWFPDTTPLAEALIASSAIPAVFPWVTYDRDGEHRILVDGGVVNNQPVSELVVRERCGTLFVCAVGPSKPAPAPTNLVNNAVPA